MKRTKIWLSVAAVLAGTVSTWAGEPGQTPSYSADSSGVTTFVGDIPMESEDYTQHNPIQQTSCNECTECSGGCSGASSSSCGGGCSGGCDTGCDSLCDDGCDSMGCGSGVLPSLGLFKSSGSRCGGCPDTWGRIETLLWWAEDRYSPALIATNGATLAPENGVTQFGGAIESDLMFGNRVDMGKYFGSDQVLGAGARVYGLWNGETSTSLTSAGNPSLGVPFFNTFQGPIGGPDAFLIGFDDNLNVAPNPQLSGSVSAESTFDFIGTEAYARAQFGKGKNYRIDLIGGYTYHSIDDGISLSGDSTQFNVAGPVDIFRWQDSFTASNTFHGGQVGFESQVLSGRFMLTSLTKVHLGNMRQQVRLAGNSSLETFGVGTTTFANNGLLVQGNNGVVSQDTFTFAPEVNVKLGYRLSKCATFTVGYSFLMWSDVALAGNHIDNRIDSTLVGTNNPAGNPPFLALQSDSFFLHGLDLGLSFIF